MFNIRNKFPKECQNFIENINLFNKNTNYIMLCANKDIKHRILPLIANRRLQDIKISKSIEGIILMNKND